MMKINNIITADNGFFASWKRVNETLYNTFFADVEKATFFADVETATLDAFVFLNYGNRIASPYFESKGATNLDEVMSLILAVNAKSWQRLFDALTADVQVNEPYSITETKTGTEKRTDTNNVESIDATKAFNSADFVSANKATTDTDTDGTTTYDVTTKRTGNNGKDISDIQTKQITLARNKFLDSVLYNIMDVCALSIYDDNEETG